MKPSEDGGLQFPWRTAKLDRQDSVELNQPWYSWKSPFTHWFQLLSSQLPQHFFDGFFDLAFLVLHSGNVGLSLLVLLEVEVRRHYISKYGAHKRKETHRREFLGVNRLGINVQHELRWSFCFIIYHSLYSLIHIP